MKTKYMDDYTVARYANMALAEVGDRESAWSTCGTLKWNPVESPNGYKAFLLVLLHRDGPDAPLVCLSHAEPLRWGECKMITIAEALLGHRCRAVEEDTTE